MFILTIMKKIIEKIKNSKIVGIGTGKTVKRFINYLLKDKDFQNICELKNILFVPTSWDTEHLLINNNLKTKNLKFTDNIDIYIDSADFVDEKQNLIKGLGGAFFKEKIAMTIAKESIILVDKNKIVDNFDDKSKSFYIPVEINPNVFTYFNKKFKSELMISKNTIGPIFTENGNFIVFVEYSDLNKLQLCGVVANGFFEHKKFKYTVHVINDEF
ncbi:Ribose-5-phosphate isomerase A [Dictyocoela muelleri]|nr:Ribose-5-phosphate isomerase A [Dictyocoela muelleri]